MKQTLKKEILGLLDIRDEQNFTDLELFKLLDKKRKSIHPERTTDEEVKKEYEEKFKKFNDLYRKFGEYVKAESTNNGLQIYKNEIEFDYVNIKFENEELKGKIESLENKIYFLEIDIKKKEETLKNLYNQKAKEETEKLKEVFKPKKNNLIILGVSALLGILIHILSQTEQAVSIYMKYIPFLNAKTINVITLIILLIITLIFVTGYLKKLIVQKWTENVKSTDFMIRLFDYVKENKEPTDETSYFLRNTYRFKERVVYNFINDTFKAKSITQRLLRRLINLNEYSVFENFKKIVIYDLISKEIIAIFGNSGFDKVLKYEE